MLGLIWVQTVCKGYQQPILVGKELNIQFNQQRFVGPDLGPNCLQRLSAEGTSRQRVKYSV